MRGSKHAIRDSAGQPIPLAERPLIDESGKITPAGHRHSDRLMDRTMERLQREAAGQPEPIAEILPFRRQRG